MIEMSLERGGIGLDDQKVPSIDIVTTKFNFPLLIIIPLNSLGVDSVDIGLKWRWNSSSSETEHKELETETQAEGFFEVKLGWGILSLSVKGSASHSSKDSEIHDTHYEKDNSAKYTVKLHADQLPVPKGVLTIIEVFILAIQPIEVPATSKNQR